MFLGQRGVSIMPSCSTKSKAATKVITSDTQNSMGAVCGKLETPAESESAEIITASSRKKYSNKIAEISIVLENESSKGKPKILQFPLIKKNVPENTKYLSYSFGERSGLSTEHKVVMLMGVTGAGKSTLINAMVNYIIGVEWEDEFRFKMVDDQREGQYKSQIHSQTQIITSYTIYKNIHHNIPYTLTIIDTPGFGDVKRCCSRSRYH